MLRLQMLNKLENDYRLYSLDAERKSLSENGKDIYVSSEEPDDPSKDKTDDQIYRFFSNSAKYDNNLKQLHRYSNPPPHPRLVEGNDQLINYRRDQHQPNYCRNCANFRHSIGNLSAINESDYPELPSNGCFLCFMKQQKTKKICESCSMQFNAIMYKDGSEKNNKICYNCNKNFEKSKNRLTYFANEEQLLEKKPTRPQQIQDYHERHQSRERTQSRERAHSTERPRSRSRAFSSDRPQSRALSTERIDRARTQSRERTYNNEPTPVREKNSGHSDRLSGGHRQRTLSYQEPEHHNREKFTKYSLDEEFSPQKSVKYQDQKVGKYQDEDYIRQKGVKHQNQDTTSLKKNLKYQDLEYQPKNSKYLDDDYNQKKNSKYLLDEEDYGPQKMAKYQESDYRQSKLPRYPEPQNLPQKQYQNYATTDQHATQKQSQSQLYSDSKMTRKQLERLQEQIQIPQKQSRNSEIHVSRKPSQQSYQDQPTIGNQNVSVNYEPDSLFNPENKIIEPKVSVKIKNGELTVDQLRSMREYSESKMSNYAKNYGDLRMKPSRLQSRKIEEIETVTPELPVKKHKRRPKRDSRLRRVEVNWDVSQKFIALTSRENSL